MEKVKIKKKNSKQKPFDEAYDEFLRYCKVRNLRLIEDYIMFCKENTTQCDMTVNANVIGMRAILFFFIKLGYTKEFKISPLKIDKLIFTT
ncbi:hypothetical protein [Clostridium estertheticum]|uniref:Uncharacterized protein n=1 Tax=Clostridium estertheticum TaxID=238834 RepID=A0A7Y3WSD8_9CLOT|nr:hypothetical protein [Clostridium estertheticum]NNU75870.1 hypothetical protein [Clostridium estertheticum]WBL46551.1 hypothetical protein LOR37_18040 [Clostridium estertheticum]